MKNEKDLTQNVEVDPLWDENVVFPTLIEKQNHVRLQTYFAIQYTSSSL